MEAGPFPVLKVESGKNLGQGERGNRKDRDHTGSQGNAVGLGASQGCSSKGVKARPGRDLRQPKAVKAIFFGLDHFLYQFGLKNA